MTAIAYIPSNKAYLLEDVSGTNLWVEYDMDSPPFLTFFSATPGDSTSQNGLDQNYLFLKTPEPAEGKDYREGKN